MRKKIEKVEKQAQQSYERMVPNINSSAVGGAPVSKVESIHEVDLKDKAVVVFHGLPESVNYCLASTAHQISQIMRQFASLHGLLEKLL